MTTAKKAVKNETTKVSTAQTPNGETGAHSEAVEIQPVDYGPRKVLDRAEYQEYCAERGIPFEGE